MLDRKSSENNRLAEISPRLSRAVESLHKSGHPLGEALARRVECHQEKISNYNIAKRNFMAEKGERPAAPLNDMGTLPELKSCKRAVKDNVSEIHSAMAQTADLTLSQASHAPTHYVEQQIEKGGGEWALRNFKESHQGELETISAYWEELNQELPNGRLRSELKHKLEAEWEHGVAEHGYTQDSDEQMRDEDFGGDSRG